MMDILTTEKNKTVMTKDIIKEVASYSINYALADYFIKNELTESETTYETFDEQIEKVIKNARADEDAVATLLESRFLNTGIDSDGIVQKEQKGRKLESRPLMTLLFLS